MNLKVLENELERVNIDYNKLEVQKNQVEESSKLFLSEIKSLQT